ncbi:MAG: sel1 repeat family protein [Treponema sp.]|nr:sel1 repeat family protein [Treponema sp.]
MRKYDDFEVDSVVLERLNEIGGFDKYKGFDRVAMAALCGDSKAQMLCEVEFMSIKSNLTASEDIIEGLETWLRISATNGDPKALFRLGELCMSGKGGFPKDIKEGLICLNESAELGYEYAQEELIMIYCVPNSEYLDIERGLYWINKTTGKPFSDYWYGMLCLHGVGVPRDTTRAKELITRAANMGYDIAKVEVEDPRFKALTGGGCYVATCIYGSYDCPQVLALRHFRDNTLIQSFFGRLFVQVYYALSPVIVKHIGHKKGFRTVLKPLLDKIVYILQK